MRSLVAAILAVALGASGIGPAGAAELQAGDSARAVALLNTGCETRTVAQASPSPSPTPSATASPQSGGPTAPPPPRAPTGPEQLLPPALPQATPAVTPPPVPSPTPTASPSTGPIFVQRASPAPSPAPSASPVGAPAGGVPEPSPAPSGSPAPTPTPAETLAPNQYVVLADDVSGTNKPGAPADLDGNVNVIYAEGILVGDHAHYDGTRYIDVTGRPFIRNRADDTVLHADSIRFDTLTSRAILINGKGSTTQGVETGHFYYSAKTLRTDGATGVSHGERASFTTCDNPRGGYHIEAKSLDVFPGDKAVAHSAVLFLGALAIFYLPVVVIPLNHLSGGPGRAAGFIPVVGYSQTEGFYVKAKIGFAPSDYYYGYYRVDAYTKLGLGLGYVAFFRRKDGKRAVDVNFYRFKDKQDGSQQNNLQVNDTENFSRTLRAQLGVNYQGNYGPFVSLPPSYTVTGSVVHTGPHESQNYTFNRYGQGSNSTSLNLGFVDQRQLSPAVSNGVNVSYTANSNSYTGATTTVDSLHFNTLTHATTRGADYDLSFDKTESATPFGIDKLPELLIRPHGVLDPKLHFLPITGQFAVGEYSEPQSSLSTQRAEAQVTFGPAVAHFLGSDFNAQVVARQDAYGTGDLKAQIQQNASLTTAFGSHINNSITYSEQNSNGPQAEPFKTFDIIGGAAHQASDVVRFYNGDVYTLTLQTTTLFNRQAQPLSYQLNLRPSPRSSLLLGGSYVPGPGNGFYSTNVQVVTPFGRGSDIQFSTNVDWKARGRLESKNIYYRRIIGNCYELLASYNQDLKQVTFSVVILAFPSEQANFGLQQQGSIIPGSLNFSTGP